MPFYVTVENPGQVVKPGESCVWYSADKHSATAWLYTDLGKEGGWSKTVMERIGKHKGGFKSSEANYTKLRAKALLAAKEREVPFVDHDVTLKPWLKTP